MKVVRSVAYVFSHLTGFGFAMLSFVSAFAVLAALSEGRVRDAAVNTAAMFGCFWLMGTCMSVAIKQDVELHKLKVDGK